MAAMGHDPIGVLERPTALPGLSALRAGPDRYINTNERPPPSVADAAADPDLVQTVFEVAGSFGWTEGRLAGSRWTDWLPPVPTSFPPPLPPRTRALPG